MAEQSAARMNANPAVFVGLIFWACAVERLGNAPRRPDDDGSEGSLRLR